MIVLFPFCPISLAFFLFFGMLCLTKSYLVIQILYFLPPIPFYSISIILVFCSFHPTEAYFTELLPSGCRTYSARLCSGLGLFAYSDGQSGTHRRGPPVVTVVVGFFQHSDDGTNISSMLEIRFNLFISPLESWVNLLIEGNLIANSLCCGFHRLSFTVP